MSRLPSVQSTHALAGHALAGLVLTCLGMSCGSSGKGPSISLRSASEVMDATNRCDFASARDGLPLKTDVSKVRVTLRSRDADGKTVDFCDRVIDYPGDPPFLRLPAQNATRIDVFAEAFGPADAMDSPNAGGFRRLSTGSLYGVDPTAQTLGALRLYDVAAARCAGARFLLPRAFHSATPLPDGRVLFIGGLVASSSGVATIDFDTTNGAPATGSAEIYDPRDQTIVSVMEPTSPMPRAFHAAQLLDGNASCPSGQLAILLVGGVTLGDATGVGPQLLNVFPGVGDGRLVPFKSDGTPLNTQAAANQILCLDPVTHAGRREDAPGAPPCAFSASGLGPSGLIQTGGLSYDFSKAQPVKPVTSTVRYPGSGVAPTVAMIGSERIGATLTQIDANRALVWGGASSPTTVGDLVTVLAGSLGVTPVDVVGTGRTAFHTATLLPDGSSVLVTGGFELLTGDTKQPPVISSAVRLVTLSSEGASSVNAVNISSFGGYAKTCTEDARYRPAGFESATAIDRGRVLVTGGSPSTLAAANHCQDCTGSLLCAISQVSIYTAETSAIEPAAHPLQVARLGHTSTRLPDGTVLIAGGIGSETRNGNLIAVPVFLGDVEVFNPRNTVPPYDQRMGGVDGDDPIAADLMEVGLKRAPGLEATSPDSPDSPARRCGSL